MRENTGKTVKMPRDKLVGEGKTWIDIIWDRGYDKRAHKNAHNCILQLFQKKYGQMIIIT